MGPGQLSPPWSHVSGPQGQQAWPTNLPPVILARGTRDTTLDSRNQHIYNTVFVGGGVVVGNLQDFMQLLKLA